VVQLRPLERRQLLEVWSDQKIRIGQDWRAVIEEKLRRVRFAVLLISADFLASDFINDVELPALLAAAAESGCEIIPIPVAASTFRHTPELYRFQNPNRGDRTLAAMSTEEAEQVLADVAGELLRRLG
jgi:hypothetical protein